MASRYAVRREELENGRRYLRRREERDPVGRREISSRKRRDSERMGSACDDVVGLGRGLGDDVVVVVWGRRSGQTGVALNAWWAEWTHTGTYYVWY
jgi:hypothetical protein